MDENKEQIKIRKTWPKDFRPETIIETSKPLKKNRSSEKQSFKKALRNIDLTNLEELDDLEF